MAPSRYGIPRIEAITKAVAPMTGGINAPPVEAVASTAAATSGRKPMRFIIGMVMAPSATMFDTTLPLMEPNSPLATTATLAGPPRKAPSNAMARSLKNLPPPVA
jgi:hypothetical protein